MVEGSGLENRQAFTRLEGSNPSLSARIPTCENSARLRLAARPARRGLAGLARFPQLLRGEVAEWLKAQVC